MINRPRGTRDIIFPQSLIYERIKSVCLEILNSNNYQQIIIPTYEYEELFLSSLGNSTDIVNKEMFVFNDRKDRKLALRPEGTASVVRAVQQNKLIQSDTKPLKLYYWANMFRYERPQNGRYREFWQLGVELININGVYADCEILYIISTIFQRLKIPNFLISVNYLGGPKNRDHYKSVLELSVKNRISELCADCRKRYALNPLRIMDCQICSSLQGIPDYSDSLNDQDLKYFQVLSKQLSLLEIPYVIDRKLVRGLDYYTGLVFEVKANGKKKSFAGGGRYDDLFNLVGRKNQIPSIGFAIGIDRLADYLEFLQPQTFSSLESVDVLLLPLCERAISFSLISRKKLTDSICDKRFEVILNNWDSTNKVFRQINYYDPRVVIFIGENELKMNNFSVKNRVSKKQFIVSDKDLISTIEREIKN